MKKLKLSVETGQVHMAFSVPPNPTRSDLPVGHHR